MDTQEISRELGTDIQLSDELFFKFSQFTYQKCGINIKLKKKTLLSNRLRKRIKTLQLKDYEDYWNYLNNSLAGRDELTFFFDVISTNETFFQRGTDHYDVLRNRIIPTLLKANSSHLHIWSAGCSSGEESYDISMVMTELQEIFPQLSYSLLATDLSQKELSVAEKGEYGDHAIHKLNKYQINKYFNELNPTNSSLPYSKRVLKVKDFLKKNITFRRHNLLADPYPQAYDIIFCRNVMIYFDEKTQKKVLSAFYGALAPYSFLFIGHSESLQALNSPFDFMRFPEGSVYVKKGGSHV